jgi:hypothetical protein
MISKTTRPSIEALAALLCPTTVSAQDNADTPEQGRLRNQSLLYGRSIPDPASIEQCLGQNISGGTCRSIFEPATRAVASIIAR